MEGQNGSRRNGIAAFRVNAESHVLPPTPKIFTLSNQRKPFATTPSLDIFKLHETDPSLYEQVDNSSTLQFEVYEVLHKNKYVFHLKHPCKVNFLGKLQVTLVTGSVEILGLECDANSVPKFKSVNVFSSNASSALYIETKGTADDTYKEKLVNYFTNSGNVLHSGNMKKITKELQLCDALVIVEDVKDVLSQVFKRHSKKSLFPQPPISNTLVPFAAKVLNCQFLNDGGSKNQFYKSPEWENISLAPGQCTALFGGKGVGKSTLLRYLINKTLKHFDRILCLDLDPGQPEFTPSGFLSAVVVENPLLGPSFCHMKQPERMYYLGDVNVSQCPSKYLNCAEEVINYCLQDSHLKKLPCIVNTMGFNKGLGVALMVNLLDILQPDVVVQVTSKDHSKNFPFPITTQQIQKSTHLAFIQLKHQPLNFESVLIQSAAENTSTGMSKSSSFQPKELRDLLMLSYWSPLMPPPSYSLNAVPPYSIPFSKLYLSVTSAISAIQPSDILKVFNGSMVDMSHFDGTDGDILKPNCSDYYSVVLQRRVLPSLGLGLVRGIDCTSKRLFLLCNLSEEDLDQVNCLSMGVIQPPPSVYVNQTNVHCPVPYTAVTTNEANTQPIKRSYRTLPLF